jgi:hypothetical protein
MITNRFVRGCSLLGGLCPILGADWEWRSAASCGQLPEVVWVSHQAVIEEAAAPSDSTNCPTLTRVV